jgi:hypothetical protein
MEGTQLMAESKREARESAFDQVASGLAAGAISRGAVVKSLVGGFAGGLVSRIAVSPHPARARRRKQLKTLFAVVSDDAKLIRGKGVEIAFRLPDGPTGECTVLFNRPVNTCAYAASTINGIAGQTSVTGHDQITNRVLVHTTNSSGTPQNIGFSLIVTC